MKKFRLVMYIGNCENFGTEWEETRKEVRIVEAESKEEVEEIYNDTIHDCDCKRYYIEELGVPCYKVMVGDECKGQYEELEDAVRAFKYGLNFFEDFNDAAGAIRIEVGILE